MSEFALGMVPYSQVKNPVRLTGFYFYEAVYAADFFLRSAQRFFMASPILFHAAADSRRFRPSALPGVTRLFWLPRRL